LKPYRYVAALVVALAVICILHFARLTSNQAVTLAEENALLKEEIGELTKRSTELDAAYKMQVDLLSRQVKELQDGQQALRDRTEFLDRGSADRPMKQSMTVTAYDLSYQSCQKVPSDPEYGITASGQKVKEWHTAAAGSALPFGTKIYIPYFKDMPNAGMFVVQDRGSAIKDNCIDVYISDSGACRKFGRQRLDVWIVK
jgi:3D (Asp-Asp-Asp) domain-containing protein